MTRTALSATDWSAQDAVTDEEIDRQIAEDEDVAPLIVPIDVKAVRAVTGLSQTAFASRYQIPVGTLRDWEQGRKIPTGTARVLLRVIQHDRSAVDRALAIEEGR
jgi:putative transcriptional regulator